ncbi:glycosyltransferase family 2 protein [Rasiella sp. SM2506]|uniref:glycosyltransferase family 2 protein n=1 Tax=Rasiella sp. SM2506 TaxID=3423914 RepID=UPI003D7BDF76
MSLKNLSHKINIIIVTYNGIPWLQECLSSCEDFPVVVVDNDSSDGTVALIKKKFPKVQVFPQKQNLGFGQANNLGIRYALANGANYVFLLNQDAYLETGCIEKLVAVQKRNAKYGILSPVHLNGNGNVLDKSFSGFLAYKNNRFFYSDFVLKKPLQEIYDVPFVNAAGWLLSKNILETIGGFDPIFFHYGEDDNFCQRARFHGFKIGVVPTTYLRHDRENRPIEKFEKGTEKYFQRMELSLRVRYANINNEDISKMKEQLFIKKKDLLKACISLNFNRVNLLLKEIKLFNKNTSVIKNSRKINTEIKSKYLYINN